MDFGETLGISCIVLMEAIELGVVWLIPWEQWISVVYIIYA